MLDLQGVQTRTPSPCLICKGSNNCIINLIQIWGRCTWTCHIILERLWLWGNDGTRSSFCVSTKPRSITDHKALFKQFETCVGVAKGLKELILHAIQENFVFKLHAEQMGYLNITLVFQMMTNLSPLHSIGSIDFVDINALNAECNAAWSPA